MCVRSKFWLCLMMPVCLFGTLDLRAEGFLCFETEFDAVCTVDPQRLDNLTDCIEIVGFNEQVISEAGTTTTYFGPLKVIKRIDETTPRLFAKAGSGVLGYDPLNHDTSGLPLVNVALIGDRGDKIYVRYAVSFLGAQITSISQTGGEGEPLEQVEFTPLEKVKWSYQPLDEAGACLPVVEGEATAPQLP